MIVTLSTTSLSTRAAHIPAKLPPITRALVVDMAFPFTNPSRIHKVDPAVAARGRVDPVTHPLQPNAGAEPRAGAAARHEGGLWRGGSGAWFGGEARPAVAHPRPVAARPRSTCSRRKCHSTPTPVSPCAFRGRGARD